MEQSALGHGPRYRTAVATFIIGLALGLMARELAVSAYAQVMDPGQQRNEMNQGIAQLNAKMTEMVGILRTGTLKVRVVGSDKTTGSAQSVLFQSAPTGTPSSPGGSEPESPPRDVPR